MAYVLGEPTVQQYFDANGDPLAEGIIEFYLSGTSTPTPIYSDSLGAPVGVSVTLNSIGAPQTSGGTPIALFFDTHVSYKIVRKDSDGSVIPPTIDPYHPFGDSETTIKYDSVESAYNAFNGGANLIETLSYFAGWAASSEGPSGGARYHLDGTTVTPSTLYVDGSGFYDASGNGYTIFVGAEIEVEQFGAVGDGATDDSNPIRS